MSSAVVSGLERLRVLGLSPVQVGAVLALLAAERRAAHETEDSLELVWSGPKAEGSRTRDSAVVVRELFKGARREVLVSSYGLDHGEKAEGLFRPLAEAVAQRPGLKVRKCPNIQRMQRNSEKNEALVAAFVATFQDQVWAE